MDITADTTPLQSPQPIVSLETDSLDTQPTAPNPVLTGSLAPVPATSPPKTTYSTRWAVLLSGFVLTLLILTGLAGLAIAHFSHQPTTTASKSATVALDNYDVMNIPLQSLAKAGQLQLGPTSQLLVNGQLRLNNDLVLLPTSQPTKPTAGQFYFSQTTDQPYYYNGSQYVSLLGSGQAVTSIGGLQGTVTLGSGLQVANGQLTATPSATTTPTTPQQVVTSLQGQTGTVNLLAGTGINLNGTTISNDGVTSLGGSTGAISLGAGLQVTNHTLASTTSITAGSSNLNVTSDGNGHFTISETGVGASGVVALGPASAQTDSSTNPAISINKTSTGDLLDVTVNGTSQFVVTSTGQITSGSIDYDQVIGAPLTTVTSLGGSSAAISLGQGLTMAGSILSNSGVTSLTGTANQVMVSTSSGDVTLSLPQNLAVSSSPSFASLSITGMATAHNFIQNGNAVCDASGNCVGTGTAGSAIGGNGTANTLAMFTAAGTIGNSILSQNSAGTTMTVGGSLTATSLTGNGAGVTNVNASELAGNTSSYYTSASNIDSGILGDAYLQGDVALYDATTANFTGTNLEHNGNQVCDTSNNCGYLTGSAANGQYIELQTGTPTAQTGNLAVTGSGTAGSLAATTITQDGNTVCDTSGNCSGVYGGSGPTGVTSLNSQAGALNLLGTSGQVTVTTSGTNLTVALANTAVTVGSYGTASSVAQFSVNASGQLTAASATPIAIAGSQVTSGTISNARLNSDVATYDNTTSNFTGTNLQHNGNAVCDASGNCVGTGTAGSAIGGNGTANTLAMFTAAGTIGNSILSQNSAGTTMTVGGSLTATSLTGNGAGVTNVNASELAGNTSSYYTSASNIDSGILGDAYLQGDVALYDATTANFTGTNLEHNGNQVCDTSNNCGYLTGSAANGQYIELQTGTPTAQTGNLAVTGSGTAGSLAATTITQDGNTVCDTSGNCSGVYGGSGPSGVTSLNSQAGALNLLGTSGQVTVTTSGTNLTVALANTAVTVGSYGTASSVAQFSVNASGQLTAASATPIAIAGSQVTSGTISNARLNSDVATYDNTTSNFTGTNLQHNGNAVCDASGNCVGTGTAGSAIGGNGTANTLAMFTAAGTIGNSILSQNSAGTTMTVGGSLTATSLTGNGAGVTNVNASELAGNTSSYYTSASNIDSGILGDAYLQGDVALYDATTANFTGTNLEHNGNQVCDTSNNCGYLTGSAANGQYIELQTGTPTAQTGNLAVTGSGTAGSLAATTITQDGNTVCDTSGNCSGVYGGSGPTGVTSLNSQAGALNLLGTSGQVTVTTSGTNLTVALANTAVTVGSYGTASSVAQFSVNASGQLTAASATPIAIAGSQVTSGTISNARLNSDVATYDNTTSNFTGTNLQHNGNAVCDASGNCVGTGTAGSAIGGNGTANTLALFTAAGTIGNSILTQSGSTISLTGTLSATDLQGDGAGLTSLNASSVSSGTLATNYGGTGLDGSTAAYGQLLIGTGSGYTLATLTPGSGIAIANASGSITVGVNSTVCTTAGNCSVGSGIGGGEAFLQGGNSFGTTAVLGTNDNNPLNIETDGTTRLSVTAGGNVGVGTSTPSYALDVNGAINTSNDYLIGGQVALATSGTSHNASVGTGYILSGSSNVAVGNGALLSNTGSYNTATGVSTLIVNTGSDNTADGLQSLNYNTTGSDNTGSGAYSLSENTTGSGNTGSGALTLASNTTGSDNTALGYMANVASGNLQNATAIGYDATVNVSNALVLGNGANVGIGTSAPSYALDVQGGDINTSGNLRIAGTAVITSGDALQNVMANTSILTAGTLGVARGGTGIGSYTIGSLLYAASSSTLAQLNDVISGSCLISEGTTAAPQWGSCGSGGGGTAFVNGGNSFGATATLGTKDANSLVLITNNTTRATLDTAGNFNLASGAYQIAGSNILTNSALSFTAAGTISTSTGNLTIQANAVSTLSLDTTGAGTVNVGTTNASTVNIGSVGTTAKATAVNIATSTGASQTVNVGSSAAGITLQGGTVSESLNSTTGLVFQGTTSAYDAATTGANLFIGFSAASGWTISGSGASETATANGSTTTAVKASSMTIVVNDYYLVTYTTANNYNNGTIYFALGGVNGNQNTDVANTYTQIIQASATTKLSFTPANTFDGTISAVSVQQITASTATLNVDSSTVAGSQTELQIRGGDNAGNTFIGLQAGEFNTGGTGNTALGAYALQDTTTGTANVALGSDSLQFNTTGNDNVATGNQALQANTTGLYNVADGWEALQANTTGQGNVAIGAQALPVNTTGTANIAIGVSALNSNTTANYNIAVGAAALSSNTTGSANVATGTSALTFNTSGQGNTANGYQALAYNTSGTGNVAIGYNTLNNNETGSLDTGIGYNAEVCGDGISNSTAIGANSVVCASDTISIGVEGGSTVYCVAIDLESCGPGQTEADEALGINGSAIASGDFQDYGSPDISEAIPAAPDVAPDDVVSAGPDGQVDAVLSTTAYDPTAIGIISDGTSGFKNDDTYGFSTSTDTNSQDLVLSGRVPVNVTDQNGPIEPGDYLTTSSTPGYAMKATQAGSTIGKALAAFSGTSGTVMVQASLGYYNPVVGSDIQNGQPASFSSLDVSGQTTLADLTVSGNASLASLTVSGTTALQALTVSGNVTMMGTLTVNGNVSLNGNELSLSNNVRGTNVAVAGSAQSLAVTFGTAYPDGNYSVLCTPNFNSTCYVTGKTATGFTLNFGTPAPNDGSGTVEWLVVH